MSSTTPERRNPYFGLEIEIFVRVRPGVETDVVKKVKAKEKLPAHWSKWDFDLTNCRLGPVHAMKKEVQRQRVAHAIIDGVKRTLGKDHGWTCVTDQSLKEWVISEAKGAKSKDKKWWGVEIISPPTAAESDWQRTIHKVFRAISKDFELYTNHLCSSHVHVSRGPDPKAKYGKTDLIDIAKGAFFWEEALRGLLPYARQVNRYALPNHDAFASDEYLRVGVDGWGPLFDKLVDLMGAQGTPDKERKEAFAKGLHAVARDGTPVKYLSTNFLSFLRIDTVEFRRQAGAASATTAIYRVLLALTLNVSALHYPFRNASGWKGYKSTEELILEAMRTLHELPRNCEQPGFEGWLRTCAADYAHESDTYTKFTEKDINKKEKQLRKKEGSEPEQEAEAGSSSAPPEGVTSLPVRQAPNQPAEPLSSAQTGQGRQGGVSSGGQNASRPSQSAQTGQRRQGGASSGGQTPPVASSSGRTGQRVQGGASSGVQNASRQSSTAQTGQGRQSGASSGGQNASRPSRSAQTSQGRQGGSTTTAQPPARAARRGGEGQAQPSRTNTAGASAGVVTVAPGYSAEQVRLPGGTLVTVRPPITGEDVISGGSPHS